MEDEWERELEAEEDLDLLFVTYHVERMTIATLVAKINDLGFEVELRENAGPQE